MQVLEMEDTDALLITSRRKTLNTKTFGRPTDSPLSFMVRRHFMSYVIVVAVVALLLLFLSSMSDGTVKKIDRGGEGTTESKVTPTSTTEAPTSDPIDPPGPPTPLPTETPNSPPPTSTPTDPPQSNPTHEGAMKVSRGEDINVYSKFSHFDGITDPPLPDEETAKALAEKWGKWKFWDGEEDTRPKDDFLSKYPNYDCPGEEFPEDAWQRNAVFVNHYLNDANKLITRAIEAIFSEYGKGREGVPREQLSQTLAERAVQFRWEICDMTTSDSPPEPYSNRRSLKNTGGWTTARSQKGLERRLLHAMMTSDTFTVVMGGHSAAAAEGNNFRQSYMMQFHKIMAPIFARLGVKLITRNMGMGGLGTLHNSLGSGSIYGDEVDLLLWDSGMTEPEGPAQDIFVRQGLMGGARVPVIWTSGMQFHVLKAVHEMADADIGEWGTAMYGIPDTASEEHANSLPWAVQYLKCTNEMSDLCQQTKYCAQCWQDREDGLTPPLKQLNSPRGQAGWHPGWREHQLRGRNLAMAVLRSLQDAIATWTDNVRAGPPLADQLWHVTDYYENIRHKVRTMDPIHSECYSYQQKGELPGRVCNTPLKALTHYQPRSNHENGAINAFVKPADDGYVPKNEKKNFFDGPDPHNPCFDLPEGAVDVYGIVAGRRRLETEEVKPRPGIGVEDSTIGSTYTTNEVSRRNLEDDNITPGKGWEIWAEEHAGVCDGTYNSECQREGECILQGQQAGRGAIIGNEYSGWLVVTLKGVKEGIIILKLHLWHLAEESTRTAGWASVNNERKLRAPSLHAVESNATTSLHAGEYHRSLGARSTDPTPQLDTMAFEYAIDGQIYRLPRDEFLSSVKKLQRVVEVLTILDDPNFTTEPKDVEIAVRMTGCGRECTYGVSHIYWA